ncbi:outer membrane beta-barrel protein [Aquimarina sp. MMG016]|uniref:outer membrane beta-barrel protein n=1 Tax=Aquimarina sp. MMG016 TaxID=2822690 RepID=UPI001B3A0534|nr:outer membrane beta-barrel protein [Aquimarina sp. MMG016]MBQ4821669.1 outer membrane beta-barrel protein [Aquimarina sp. MMG016]
MNFNKTSFLLVSLLVIVTSLVAQDQNDSKYYIGISAGSSFPLGDFKDVSENNANSGFAETGAKFDIYGGYRFQEKLILTGTIRLQRYSTDTNDLINSLEINNPGINFTNDSDNWNVLYLLAGLAYQIDISKKFAVSPRIGIGPMIVNSPDIFVTATNGSSTVNYQRDGDAVTGFGYEIGIGLKRDLGKHFALMPTFTFTGGFITIESATRIGGVIVYSEYQPNIITFNLGLSLAYKF